MALHRDQLIVISMNPQYQDVSQTNISKKKTNELKAICIKTVFIRFIRILLAEANLDINIIQEQVLIKNGVISIAVQLVFEYAKSIRRAYKVINTRLKTLDELVGFSKSYAALDIPADLSTALLDDLYSILKEFKINLYIEAA